MSHCSIAALSFAATLAVLVSAPAEASVYYALSSGQAGAQTQIDTGHTSRWSFTTGDAWSFGGGTFTMKDGPNSSADVKLSLYQQTLGGYTLAGAATLQSAAFTQHYTPVAFTFASPLALLSGATYVAELTSTAPDQQNSAYFIKGIDFRIVDGNGQAAPADTTTGASLPASGIVPLSESQPAVQPTAVAEPAGIALMLGGMLGLVALRRRPVTA